jgi:excisionase family DNA binding protein
MDHLLHTYTSLEGIIEEGVNGDKVKIYTGDLLEADEPTTMRIAELTRQLASEEWLTGNLKSAAPTESIHEIVMSRLDVLDELLSTREWPTWSPSQEEEVGDSPYLTIAQAAKLLRVGEDTIQRMITNGDLPVVEITGQKSGGGRKLKRILRESLQAAIKKKERTEYSPAARSRKRNPTPDFIGDD